MVDSTRAPMPASVTSKAMILLVLTSMPTTQKPSPAALGTAVMASLLRPAVPGTATFLVVTAPRPPLAFMSTMA